MKKEEINFLEQLVSAVDESQVQLEKAYEQNDVEKLNKLKKFISQVQEKISGMLK